MPTDLLAAWIPGGWEIPIIIGVIVLFFGGKKIPELMRGLGRGVGELKTGLEEGKKAKPDALESENKSSV